MALLHKITTTILLLLLPSFSFSATENLDEIFARKARHATAAWGYQYLEDAGNHYIWQPETLCYFDTTTGKEVWRMSNTPDLPSYLNDDLSRTGWSADGKRMAIITTRDTGAYSKGESPTIWFVVNTNGANLRPTINDSSREYWTTKTMYYGWSPAEKDVHYGFGVTACSNSVSTNVLYKITFSDDSESREEWLTYPTTHFSDHTIVSNGISTTGTTVLSYGAANQETWLYAATIYPSGSKGLLDADGYTSDRDMGSSWGDTPSSYSSFHGIDLLGDGTWMMLMPGDSHTHWRVKVIGSAADGGAENSYTPPSTFNEEIPENTPGAFGGTNDPFGCDYWSHSTYDRWGRYVIFSSTDKSPIGPGVWDMQNHQWVVQTFGGGVEHNDWNAWSDWNASSKGNVGTSYSSDRIYTQKYNDANSQETVCYTHTFYNNGGLAGGEYISLPRPVQSPDGTKISFHSTFLNSKVGTDGAPDVYWAVAYYPYPPEITQASKSGASVQLRWDWRLNTTTPRGYTSRGWPDESKNDPPPPREIEKFVVWKSLDNSNWQYVGVVSANIFNRYDFSNGTWKGSNYWTIDVPQTNGTTMYYAVTSRETSGLESRTLSNVWKVTLDGAGDISVSAEDQDHPYPDDPGGSNEYGAPTWTIADAKPSGVVATATRCDAGDCSGQFADSTEQGHWLIEWSASVDENRVRYYNLYVSTFGPSPTETQDRLVASIAATGAESYQYLDPIGDYYQSGDTVKYKVTPVDYWGRGVQTQPDYRFIRRSAIAGVGIH